MGKRKENRQGNLLSTAFDFMRPRYQFGKLDQKQIDEENPCAEKLISKLWKSCGYKNNRLDDRQKVLYIKAIFVNQLLNNATEKIQSRFKTAHPLLLLVSDQYTIFGERNTAYASKIVLGDLPNNLKSNSNSRSSEDRRKEVTQSALKEYNSYLRKDPNWTIKQEFGGKLFCRLTDHVSEKHKSLKQWVIAPRHMGITEENREDILNRMDYYEFKKEVPTDTKSRMEFFKDFSQLLKYIEGEIPLSLVSENIFQNELEVLFPDLFKEYSVRMSDADIAYSIDWLLQIAIRFYINEMKKHPENETAIIGCKGCEDSRACKKCEECGRCALYKEYERKEFLARDTIHLKNRLQYLTELEEGFQEPLKTEIPWEKVENFNICRINPRSNSKESAVNKAELAKSVEHKIECFYAKLGNPLRNEQHYLRDRIYNILQIVDEEDPLYKMCPILLLCMVLVCKRSISSSKDIKNIPSDNFQFGFLGFHTKNNDMKRWFYSMNCSKCLTYRLNRAYRTGKNT